MKVLKTVLIVALALLGLAAGAAKLMAAPQEVALFAAFGLEQPAVIIAGVVQTLGAIGLAFAKTRRLAALLTAASFAFSSVMIFATGDLTFAAVSLVPVALSLYVMWFAKKASDGPTG